MVHTFDIDIAKERGVDQAVIIQHLQFWILKNRNDGRNLRDGHYWTFTSIQALVKHFPYWTEDQIGYAVARLVMDGILIKGNFNRTAFDRTIWYAFQDEEKWLPKEEGRDAQGRKPILENSEIETGKVRNRFRKSTEPIPYIPTDESKRENKEDHMVSEEIDEAIRYLNEKTSQHYKTATPKTRQMLRILFGQGFTLGDVKRVVDKMAREWTGTKMEIYLRPETIFSNKFEGYLNRREKARMDPWIIETEQAGTPNHATVEEIVVPEQGRTNAAGASAGNRDR